MKKLLALIFILGAMVSVIGCQDDDDEPIVEIPEIKHGEIILKELKIVNDTIQIEWEKNKNDIYRSYRIMRRSYGNMDDKEITNYTVLADLYPERMSIKDNQPPIHPYVEYQILGVVSLDSIVHSNSRVYERPNLNTFKFNVHHIIPDLSNNRFYIIESQQGIISIFDYEKQEIIKSINTEAEISYCSIGEFNNVKELYVPRNDGWVFIYNAETLESIGRIDITFPSSCVVNNNGILFVSTGYSYSWNGRPIKAYDRRTKKMIAEGGDYNNTRLRVVPNTNTDLLEITLNSGSSNQYYYKFNINDSYIYRQYDRYHGDYALDHEIFQFFPDAQKYITSSKAIIYDINMNYVNRLPVGNISVSDFAFNENSSLIYCASNNRRKIISFSYPDMERMKEYKTTGYPYKIFRKDNMMICISSTTLLDNNNYYNYKPSEIIIEKIKL